VRERLAALDQAIDRQARMLLDALKASAEPFVTAGRIEEAVARLESMDEELRTPRWQQILDQEIERIRAQGK
jgi:thioredoxin-like negative regulator of GroEL